MAGRASSVRHASEYAGLLALRELFRHLPPEPAVALGACIGAAWARAHGPRTRDARVNLALAFPDWSEARREEVLERAFANLGRQLAEVCLLQGPHRERLLAGIEVIGGDHYQEARRQSESGGIIALTAHFGAWELCAAVMAERGYPVSVVGHPLSNPWADRMVSGWRRRAGVQQVRLGRASFGVLRALSSGRVVAMLLDQNAGRDEGVAAPFFGRPAMTRSGPARIAMLRRVSVLPVFIHRVGVSSRHVVRMEPPLALEPDPGPGDEDARAAAVERNVGRMNAVIEATVRASPEQWLWAHRRFRTPAPGQSSPYPRRRAASRRR